MNSRVLVSALLVLDLAAILFSGCGGEQTSIAERSAPVESTVVENPATTPTPTATVPNLQERIFKSVATTSESEIGRFDFKNFNYPLPRGWMDSDRNDAELVNGKRMMTMNDEVERTGLSLSRVGYFDATGDGKDEAAVILKIETGGSAIPQLVYIYEWKNGQPELIWYFRTGDRADGGLRDLRVEDGLVVLELYGQDRYVVGELDTSRITGDEEQLCCPTHWTRSSYKWNGNVFRLHGKRLTFQTADENAPPIENMVEFADKKNGGKK